MKNKEKILQASKKLFNQKGFVNVRLQHISDDTIISLGNIAYHYPNKEAIVTALLERWEERVKEVLIEYRNTPIFAHVDRIFISIESLQIEFGFFFTDLVEIKRSYPNLFLKIEEFLGWQVFLFGEIIRFNISRGAMNPLENEEISFLAEWVIFQIHSFPNQRIMGFRKHSISGSDSPLATHIWALLKPYLSDSGKQELATHISQTIKMTSKLPNS
ncbi:MAG: TetR/AcrR family transcriptional regulator [Bacteroidota bacterium]